MSEQTIGPKTPNHNEKEAYKIFKALKNLKDHYNFVTDKSGVNMVELIAPRMELDPREPLLYFNGRKTPEKYCEAELQWYQSQDLSVEFIGQKAKIWRDISSAHNEINSNSIGSISNVSKNFSSKLSIITSPLKSLRIPHFAPYYYKP